MPEKENKPKETEQVHNIPLSEIRPFRNHPFKISDDELMQQTVDSINSSSDILNG